MSSVLPEWNLESEYPSLTSDLFLQDLKSVEEASQKLSSLDKDLRALMSQSQWSEGERKNLLAGLVQSWKIQDQTNDILSNLFTYAHCRMSVNVTDQEAEKTISKLQMLAMKYRQAGQGFELFLMRAPQDLFESFVGHPEVSVAEFAWRQARLEKDLLLSEPEESLLLSMGLSGHQAWGDLYEKISGLLVCEVRHEDGRLESVGLAQAQAMTKLPDGKIRKAAWLAIQEAWGKQRHASAAILNALAGWRLELVKKRSHTRKVDFLESPLRQARIERRTLEAMLKAVELNAPKIREGAKLMAKLHGKDKLDPWDLLAPAPIKSSATLPFEQGLSAIQDAFGGVSPEFGDFVATMSKNRWIEARVLPNKQGGAYCTGFAKSKTPRVFQTYMGSLQDVSTLAHELGHAYHSWVMRDLPSAQKDYPMTLAETASIFSETVLSDRLLEISKDHEARLSASYAEVENAVALLLNIPARFDFEKSFYEKRAEGVVSDEELSALTDRAWSKWYGDCLSQNEKLFWATKMHFSFAGISFYNFPYTFGYLFSLSIYARRPSLGAEFMPKVVEILRDTGRMTAEELVRKHFGEDLGHVDFWQKSLDVVGEKIARFESLVEGH